MTKSDIRETNDNKDGSYFGAKIYRVGKIATDKDSRKE